MFNCNKNKCTCWFDKIGKYNWAECCKKHDAQYMDQSHNKSKWQVDKEFFNCIRSKTFMGYAALMWLGQNILSWYYWRKYK